jgi:hypothetical protein
MAAAGWAGCDQVVGAGAVYWLAQSLLGPFVGRNSRCIMLSWALALVPAPRATAITPSQIVRIGDSFHKQARPPAIPFTSNVGITGT